MFEVLGQYFLGEGVLIDHNKADAVECPFDNMLVLVILNGIGLTLSSSYVFLRKLEMALGLRLVRMH